MQNIFAISGFINFLVSLFISFFVFSKRRSSSNVIFSVLTFSTAIWSFGYWRWLSEYVNYDAAIFWLKFLTVGSIWIPIFFAHWISRIFIPIVDKKWNNLVIYSAYILGVIFSVLNIFSSLMVSGAEEKLGFIFWPNAGEAYIYYIIIIYVLLTSYTAILIVNSYLKSSGSLKNQIKYVSVGCFIALIGGFFNFFLWYDIPVLPYGNFIIPIYPVLISYAIIRFRLMDIRLVITRSILYAVLVGGVASFFALSVVVVGNAIGGNTQTSKIITYIVTSFIVVVFLDPVKRTWAKITDKIFYKDKIDYQELLRESGNIIAREIDLHKLLNNTTELLTDRLKVKEISVLLPDSKQDFSLLLSSKKDKQNFSLSKDFVDFVNAKKGLIIIDELIRELPESEEKSSEYKKIDHFIKEAEARKAEMIVPVAEEDEVSAIFLFSAKQSGDLYGQEDVNFLQVFVPQMATAIEKSKLYEEVEDLNKELQAKVDARTKSLKEANFALEERNKFLTTMQVVTNMISRTLDLKKVNQMIADSIATELGYIGGMLSFVDSSGKYLKVGAITNTAEAKKVFSILAKEPREYRTELKENYNLGADTFLHGKMNFADKMSDLLTPPVEKKEIDKIQDILGVKSIVAMPIFSEDKIIGVIQFYLPITKDKISSLDIEIMNALTNQVGIVSRNIKLYNTLQDANRDLQDANIKLKELDKAKSEFLSIASHQLRTPISAIKGYLSMIMEGDFGKVPKNINDVIKNIFESSSRLARLINIFLNVSRIESGRLKLDKKPMQINDLIEGVIVELINQAKQKGVKLEYKKKKKAPPLIMADADKLREVVLNLIDNAIKYTPEGSVIVTVESDDKNLNFRVKDTGIGIPKEEVKSLFRKFVRGSGVAQIHTGGSGLGLFIAQKIIKEHDGHVWAESDGKGKGSLFQFTIPVYDEHKVPAYKEEAEEK